ncbi:MAG: hypothetical protein JRN06_07275 [Nitrososphaerota archaeon]|nr:hypothetical protein [Nitrososphaerota archaeon]MDG7024418.1 hypothetical protein [Nitrososphaerota archaeon]
MSDRTFFDTNIIAYAFDRSERAKRLVCKELVDMVFSGESPGALSNQVLAELFVVLTQKVGKAVSKAKAGAIVRGLLDSSTWSKLDCDSGTVARAAADSATMPNHFWVLLIAETMRDGGVGRIYTENVSDFQGVPWIEAVNPFAARRKPGKGETGDSLKGLEGSASPAGKMPGG